MRYECIASKLRVGRLGKTILGIFVRVGTDLAFGHAEIQHGWLPWSNFPRDIGSLEPWEDNVKESMIDGKRLGIKKGNGLYY